MHPQILYRPCVCLRACVRACLCMFACVRVALLKERHCIWHLREGAVLLGRGSFCLVLPLSALLLGWCRVLSPPPPLPAQLLPCPAHTGLWVKLLWRAGSSSRQEGYYQPLQVPDSGLLKFPGWALMRG